MIIGTSWKSRTRAEAKAEPLQSAIGWILTLLFLATSVSLNADQDHHHHQHKTVTESSPPPLDLQACKFTDSPLVTSDGHPVSFYRDLIQDKIVVISFIYTSCTFQCPVTALNMRHLQEKMGDKMGSEVHLVSLSIDPVVDTPERLSDWSKNFDPGPHWTFVTGDKTNIDEVLEALKVPVVDIQDHPLRTIVANGRTDVCTTSNASPSYLQNVIDKVSTGV